jgi:hypothetical protein
MIDLESILVWVTLGVGVFALAFAEYKFSLKKRAAED